MFNQSNNVIESAMGSAPNAAASVYCKKRGFSLLEVIIALAIMGFLLGGVASVVQTGRDFDHYAENKRYMNQVHDSLLTFVKVNGFLPCPDTDDDGQENRVAVGNPICTNAFGTLPYLDLGIAATDVWNQPLRYAVNIRTDINGVNEIALPLASASYFNNQTAVVPGTVPPITGSVFGLNTLPIGNQQGVGNFNICSETTPAAAQCLGGSANPLETVAIAVVVSFGKNGAETWAGANLDAAEAENFDADQNFWQAAGSNVAGQAFDDQLIWLTGYDVKYAVLTSGGVLQ